MRANIFLLSLVTLLLVPAFLTIYKGAYMRSCCASAVSRIGFFGLFHSETSNFVERARPESLGAAAEGCFGEKWQIQACSFFMRKIL